MQHMIYRDDQFHTIKKWHLLQEEIRGEPIIKEGRKFARKEENLRRSFCKKKPQRRKIKQSLVDSVIVG